MSRPQSFQGVDDGLFEAKIWVRELALELFRLDLLKVKRTNGATVEESLRYVESSLEEIVKDAKAGAPPAGRSA